MENDKYLLDTPFTSEKINAAIKAWRSQKAAGPNRIVAEHLKADGETVSIWIRAVMHAIIELKEVYIFLKSRIVILVYKGGGRNPLTTDSYRVSVSLECW